VAKKYLKCVRKYPDSRLQWKMLHKKAILAGSLKEFREIMDNALV
jgi:hypothetical protein